MHLIHILLIISITLNILNKLNNCKIILKFFNFIPQLCNVRKMNNYIFHFHHYINNFIFMTYLRCYVE